MTDKLDEPKSRLKETSELTLNTARTRELLRRLTGSAPLPNVKIGNVPGKQVIDKANTVGNSPWDDDGLNDDEIAFFQSLAKPSAIKEPDFEQEAKDMITGDTLHNGRGKIVVPNV